jgi:hypothetical protein
MTFFRLQRSDCDRAPVFSAARFRINACPHPPSSNAPTALSIPTSENGSGKLINGSSLPGEISMTKIHSWILTILTTVVIAGCQDRNRQPAPSSAGTVTQSPNPATTPSVANNVGDQWLGKWIGPEGTYLVLTKNGAKYVIETHSLDGPATYEGTSAGDHIEFQRNGETESIHAGSGQETGMKWLLDKKHCLIIKTGEGFCRE